ncbi:MAG: polymer-forming cytoskeletal protein [Pseudomonadota bacterium]
MLSRKNKRSATIETLVGAASRVQGDLHFRGNSHIDGIIHGGVMADLEGESALSVSEQGEIHGNVKVPNVVLNGLVKGDVVATERVELGPTARVIGNVYYNLIEMAIGAEINGKLVHQVDSVDTATTTESDDTDEDEA